MYCQASLKMATRILIILSCVGSIILPAVADPASNDCSSYTILSNTESSTASSRYTSPSPTTYSTTTTIPTESSSSSSITLVTTAKPTDAPWSVSYSGYTSLNSSTAAAPSASASGVKFHPDGASPGFFCEYPSLSQYQPCNGPDSRDCWLQKTPAKIKQRCNCSDDEPDVIDIHTDCEYLPTLVVWSLLADQ